MVANEPSMGNKASEMVATKVLVARGPTRWWVELRYALQGMNKNREKQAGNLGQRKASDLWKDVGKHINGGVRKICKEVVN